MRQTSRAALTAYLLSPLLAELLSGSSPPLEFFHPLTLLLLTTLYGCGVLLVHELSVHWRGGWRAVFLLGLAYGIFEEGLVVKSFYSPDWPDLGLLAHYGRWLDINWVWAVSLTVYHAVLSISVPLLLVDLLYPDLRGRRWLDDAALGTLRWGLGGVLVAGLVAFPYRAGFWQYVSGVALAAGLCYAARRLPPVHLKPLKPHPPWRVGLGGILAVVVFLTFTFGIGGTRFSGTLATLYAIAVCAVALWQLARRVAGGWSDRHSLALVTGLVLPLILLAPLQEHDPGRADHPAGLTLVGLAALIGLVFLRRRVRRRPAEGTETCA